MDMDGTLLDTEHAYRDAFAEACAELGWDMDEAAYARCIGTTYEEGRDALIAAFGADFPIDQIHRRWAAHYPAIAAQRGLRAMPGARALLEALVEWGLPVALVTSTDRETAGAKLNETNLDRFFRVRVCGGEASASKPDPAPFLQAARLLGAEPIHCLVLEDSPNGVRAGVAAGMRVVQIPDLVPVTPELRALGHSVHESLAQTLDELRQARGIGD
ncbi:MAG: HAD family phosphatase [Pseudomonadota bacterium]